MEHVKYKSTSSELVDRLVSTDGRFPLDYQRERLQIFMYKNKRTSERPYLVPHRRCRVVSINPPK